MSYTVVRDERKVNDQKQQFLHHMKALTKADRFAFRSGSTAFVSSVFAVNPSEDFLGLSLIIIDISMAQL